MSTRSVLRRHGALGGPSPSRKKSRTNPRLRVAVLAALSRNPSRKKPRMILRLRVGALAARSQPTSLSRRRWRRSRLAGRAVVVQSRKRPRTILRRAVARVVPSLIRKMIRLRLVAVLAVLNPSRRRPRTNPSLRVEALDAWSPNLRSRKMIRLLRGARGAERKSCGTCLPSLGANRGNHGTRPSGRQWVRPGKARGHCR